MHKKNKIQKILSCKISEANFHSYHIDFDICGKDILQQRIDDFVQIMCEEIPSFAFGFHRGDNVPQDEILNTLVEAAKSIYKITEYREVSEMYKKGESIDDKIDNKYLRRGEFGELFLHSILKYLFNTNPLIAKIHFKDSFGHAVHGFDSIHINTESMTLWLGESKIYTSGINGVDALVQDLFEHFNTDYFNSEFNIISKRITDSYKMLDSMGFDSEHWIELLNRYTSLSEQLNNIVIPMFCAYETSTLDSYELDFEKFSKEFEDEVYKLKKRFDDKSKEHPLINKLNIIVILMPLKSKKEIISKLHSKLTLIQALGG
ncbi:HamA C-terminal domain-containing protein [Enterococcus sp. AZ058]|uniref:HamA C-terminal domain-containing protein n=2 Tax=Enterococcus TaxID=1350 RepID=UPI003D2A29B2